MKIYAINEGKEIKPSDLTEEQRLAYHSWTSVIDAPGKFLTLHLTIPCPIKKCAAPVGAQCRNAGKNPDKPAFHESRYRLGAFQKWVAVGMPVPASATRIVNYVIDRYEALPKSTFGGEECVIVQEKRNWSESYGHHGYEGIGVNENGQVLWCYSSGCSCDGTAGVEHKHEAQEKALVADIDLSALNPDEIDFASLVVSF